MAHMRSVSKAKSFMEEAIDFDTSHGENEVPERVCWAGVNEEAV
jgi:hypothetical protein